MEKLKLRLEDNDEVTYDLVPPGVEGYVMGRADGSTLYDPDISFAEINARELGVSRRHAALVRYRGHVHVVDLNSVNGTFLNSQLLKPEIPYAINSGDKISLGKLTLVVTISDQPV